MRRLPCLLLLSLAACGEPAALDPPPMPDVERPDMTVVDAAPPAAPPAAWIHDVEQPAPQWLSETGIFTTPSAMRPTGGWIAYAPPHPLYSNGAAKDRLLWLPPDTSVETTRDGMVFPVGTVLVKTFSLDDVEGRAGPVAIETRLSIRRAAGWDFAEYQWNAEGDEARLVGGAWIARAIRLTDADGQGFTYTLPGLLDCRGCHEAAPNPALGVVAANLDPALVDTERPVFDPPIDPEDVAGRTPAETAVMRYLVGNCVHCHHGLDTGENSSFSLLPADLVATTVDQPTESSASGAGIRVVPGDPAGSALYIATVTAHRPDYDGDFKPMPPLGIDRPDPTLPALLETWILELAE